MTYETKQKLTFIHHALWSLTKELEQSDVLLVAHISEFRNGLEPFIKQSEDSYCSSVTKGGVKLLNDVVI